MAMCKVGHVSPRPQASLCGIAYENRDQLLQSFTTLTGIAKVLLLKTLTKTKCHYVGRDTSLSIQE